MRFVTATRTVLAELATLRRPVTAAAVLATILALTAPAGVHLGGDQTAQVTGSLVAVGAIAAYADALLGRRPATRPAHLTPGANSGVSWAVKHHAAESGRPAS